MPRVGKPAEVVDRDVERNYYMSAEESVKYGLVDEIVPYSKVIGK